MANITPEQYNLLADFNQSKQSLSIQEVPTLRYYYVGYNNQHKILKERNVRWALSHLVDVNSIIKELFFGLAVRTIGPIHPNKPYYLSDYQPLSFDLTEAEKLLNQAGWKIRNGQSVLSKEVDGQLTPLSLGVVASRSQLSQDLAILMQENARKIGIDINIQPLEFRALVQRVRKGDFELAFLASTQHPGLDDPYNNWHSDNASNIGANYCKFTNDRCDRICEQIRTALNSKERDRLYRAFQEVIYEEQPALFLVAPKKIVVTNQRIRLKPSAVRPGYFVNLATFH